MENKQSYFGEIGAAFKTLTTGLKTTMKEYFTPKSTEQYPENRKTTLHVAKRHRGRLVFKRDENENYKCVACLMCEGLSKRNHQDQQRDANRPRDGKKKRQLLDYQYDLGDCMFCQLCVNACNFDAIKFTNDFENAVFDRSKLVLHLNEEIYKGGSLPNIVDGGAEWEVGTFNTKTK